MSFDSDKAKLAALKLGAAKIVAEAKARREREEQTHRCDHCGAHLQVAWRGRGETAQPLIFCGECLAKEG